MAGDFKREFPKARRTYVALTESRSERPRSVRGTTCRSATWRNLRQSCRSSSALVDDLFLSLANLDYPAFRNMKAKNLHIDNIASTLACHEVLRAVAERLGLSMWKIQHGAELDPGNGRLVEGWVGIEIMSFSKRQGSRHRIRTTVGSTWKSHLGWFGYELLPRARGNPKTMLSVWFYSKRTTAKSLIQRIGLPRSWRHGSTWPDEREPDKYFPRFELPAKGSKEDAEQFVALLSRVIPEIGKQID